MLQKAFIRSSLLTNHGSMRMSPKIKLSTVLVFEDEPNPTKVVYGNIISQMVACCFCKTGHEATVPLEHRRMLNSEWYIIICLPKVFAEIRQTNKRKRIIQHDKASSHYYYYVLLFLVKPRAFTRLLQRSRSFATTFSFFHVSLQFSYLNI